MNNGYINKIRGTAWNFSQILDKRICAHEANRGEKPKDGRVLP